MLASSLYISYDIGHKTDFVRDELAFFAGFSCLVLSIALIAILRLRDSTFKNIPTITRYLNPEEIRQCKKNQNAKSCGSCTLCH